MDPIMKEYNTYFVDKNGRRIGSLPGLIPVSRGMGLHVKGFENQIFTVDKFYLKIDHPDRDPGLYVITQEEVQES